MTRLERAFHRHDRARHALRDAESNLKAHVKIHAQQQGLLATPRPETVRAQLGI